MMIPTSINCPVCGGELKADLELKTFTCQKCFIGYKNNEKMNSFLDKKPLKIIKISEENEHENQKTSESFI